MSAEERRNGWRRLGCAVLAIAALWLTVLPRIERLPPVRERLQVLEGRGIDPAALFYTDLEAMPRIEASVQQRMARHPDAFWGGSIRQRGPREAEVSSSETSLLPEH